MPWKLPAVGGDGGGGSYNPALARLDYGIDYYLTLADLRAEDQPAKIAYVRENDAGFVFKQQFIWNASSTEADDGASVIKLDSIETGRYHIIWT